MWEEVFNLAINNGLWSVLFLILLVYVLKDSKARELKYQQTITTLADSLEIIQDVKEDVQEIKTKLLEKEFPAQKKDSGQFSLVQ